MRSFAVATLLVALAGNALAQAVPDAEAAMGFNARSPVPCEIARVEKRVGQDKPVVVVDLACINKAAAACAGFGKNQCDQWDALALILQRVRSGDIETK